VKHFQGIDIYETLPEIVAPAHSALVVWDVQAGLIGRIHDKDSYLSKLGPFIKALRVRMPVIYTLITPLPDAFRGPWAIYNQMRRMGVDDPSKLRPFLQPGSREREVPSEVAPQEGDWVLDKTSASLFVGTPVEATLRSRGVQTLLFAGIATDAGVETSARHASALGFYPVVVREGCSSMTREAHERSLASLAGQVIVASMEEIRQALG